MRYSNLFFYTLRETPGEAEIASHRMMLRAGLIRRLSSGIYTFLPLGYRSLRKVEQIIREEMDRAGAQEMLMPALQPQEIWEESGRLDIYLAENILFRTKDRQGRWYALGPTHEEVVCEVARARINSYRDLPFTLYQIQTKYRDEIRPRFGLMRGKEFSMKDAYSFDLDADGMDVSYEAMYKAYKRIFKRCGLQARPVEADSGSIGGDASHEFMVLADSGEDTVVSCDKCSYAANMERAQVGGGMQDVDPNVEQLEMEDIDTPGVRTIEELTAFLNISPREVVKTLIYMADEKPVVAILRGDHQLNDLKLKRALGADSLELADDKTIEKVTGAPVGFAGPQGIEAGVPIIMDRSVSPLSNFTTGGNKKDVHTKNVNRGRDFQVTKVADIREAAENDHCPRCNDGKLQLRRGVEVGHVFKLGTKYSKPMNVSFTDTDGVEAPVFMGCYGIGVGRTLAAVIEQNNDENGIVWPLSIAPYQVVIIPVSMKDKEQVKEAELVYEEIGNSGIEVLLDDRDERPGVKFKDADLIGFPIKIVVGRSLKEGKLELQARCRKEKELVPQALILTRVQELMEEIS